MPIKKKKKKAFSMYQQKLKPYIAIQKHNDSRGKKRFWK